MFSGYRRWLTPAVAALLLIASAAYSNPVDLTWHRHQNTTTSSSTMQQWHDEGTDRLCTDDGAGDVSCEAVLNISGSIDTTWTYTGGGDDTISGGSELGNAFAGMTNDCAAVTSVSLPGIAGTILGVCQISTGKIIVVNTTNDAVLGHEVGHKAGITGDYGNSGNPPEPDPDRIMNGSLDGDKVSSDESDKYEAL